MDLIKFLVFVVFTLSLPSFVSLADPVDSTLNFSREQLDQLMQELPQLHEDRIVYHWCDPKRAVRWIEQGYVDAGEVQFLNTPTKSLQAFGPGLYVSSSPTDSQSFGEMAVNFKIRKGTRIYDEQIVERILGRPLSPIEQAQLGEKLGYIREVSSTWSTIHNASITQEVSSAVAQNKRNIIFQKSNVPVTINQMLIEALKNKDPKRFGYLDSFIHLSRYQDGIGFQRSLQVNRENPWSEFEGENFEKFREARTKIYKQVQDSWTLTDSSFKKASQFVRTNSSPLGISNSGKFGHPNKNIADWVESQVEYLLGLRAEVGGVRDGFRVNSVRGGGDNAGGTFTATPTQLSELKKNPYLTVQARLDEKTGLYAVKYDYPHLENWRKLDAKLDRNLIDDLSKTDFKKLKADSAEFKSLHQRFVKDLVRSVFEKYAGRSVDSAGEMTRELISIHPFADFNGRTLRLYQEAAQIESNFLPSYHYLSDLDLLTSSTSYDKATYLAGREFAAFQARAIGEAVAARNQHRVPNLIDLPYNKEHLADIFKASFDYYGISMPAKFSDEQLELIRSRKWTELMTKMGNPLFDIRERSDWEEALKIYVLKPPVNAPLSSFAKTLLDELPQKIKQRAFIDEKLISEVIERAPIAIRKKAWEEIVYSDYGGEELQAKAYQKLMRGRTLSEVLKSDLKLAGKTLTKFPELLNEQALLKDKDRIFSALDLLQEEAKEHFLFELGALSIKDKTLAKNLDSYLLKQVLEMPEEGMNTNYLKLIVPLYKKVDVKSQAEIADKFRKALALYGEYDLAFGQTLIDMLDPSLKDRILKSRILEKSTLAQRNNYRFREDEIRRLFNGLSAEAIADPEIQRAVRKFMLQGIVLPSAIQNESKLKLDLALEGKFASFLKKKNMSESDSQEFSKAWHALFAAKPTSENLKQAFLRDPSDLRYRDLESILISIRPEWMKGFSTKETHGVLNYLEKYATGGASSTNVVRKATELGLWSDTILNSITKLSRELTAAEKAAIIDYGGMQNLKVRSLAADYYLSGPYLNQAILKSAEAGQMPLEDLSKHLFEFKSTDEFKRALVVLNKDPVLLQRELGSMFSKSDAIFDSKLNYQKQIAMLDYYKPNFKEWNELVESSGWMPLKDRDSFFNHLLKKQPEILDQFIANLPTLAPKQSKAWAYVINEYGAGSTRAVEAVKKILTENRHPDFIAALANNCSDKSPCGIAIKSFSAEARNNIAKTNPSLLSPLVTDGENQRVSGEIASSYGIDPRIMKMCLEAKLELKNCSVKNLSRDTIGRASPEVKGLYLEYLLENKNFLQIEDLKYALLTSYEKPITKLTQKGAAMLIEHFASGNARASNSWSAHTLILKNVRSGNVVLTPKMEWSFYRAVGKSKDSMGLGREIAEHQVARPIGWAAAAGKGIYHGCRNLVKKFVTH